MQDFCLVVFVQQNTKGKVGFFASWLDVPTSVIVGDGFAVHLKCQLGNSAAVDAELAAFIIDLNPVVDRLISAVLLGDADCSFFPHGVFLLNAFVFPFGTPIFALKAHNSKLYLSINYTISQWRKCGFYSTLCFSRKDEMHIFGAVFLQVHHQFVVAIPVGKVLHHRNIEHIGFFGGTDVEDLFLDFLSHCRSPPFDKYRHRTRH
nr:MAG TPA: hypothetical protein [Caudoviricetes sp.]